MLRSFREIELFVAVYEHRSFTVVAQVKNVTQPGVSRHIRRLEGTLGVQLFERNTTRVVPTPAGQIFYRQTIDLLRRREAAMRSVEPFWSSTAKSQAKTKRRSNSDRSVGQSQEAKHGREL